MGKKNKQANKAVEAVEAVELVTPLLNISHGYKNADGKNVSIKFKAGEQYPLTGELVQVFKQHPDYFKK
tara:strand:+ start:13447 stop:13653 length:207 start_codon:yes stop_codon:yes gene_type:complete